jgi:hypothetical protein
MSTCISRMNHWSGKNASIPPVFDETAALGGLEAESTARTATARAVKQAPSNAWCTDPVSGRAISGGRVSATTNAWSMPSRSTQGTTP